MSTTEIFSVLCKHVFSWIILGMLLSRTNFFSVTTLRKFMKRVVINVLFPILMVEKIVQHLVISDFRESLILFVGAILMVTMSWALTGIWVGKRTQGSVQKQTVWYCNSFHNYGFIVYPLVQHLLGAKGFALIFICTFTTEALMWSFGVLVLNRNKESVSFREMWNVPFITIIVSVTFAFSGGRKFVPDAFFTAIHYPGLVAIPLALTCVGGLFYFSFKGVSLKALPHRPLFFSLVSRTLVIPIMWCTLILLILPEGVASRLLIIEAIMPASVGIVALTSLYQGDEKFAVIFSLVSNLLGIISIPVFLTIFWPG